MNITLDGFISGMQGELDWHFNYWASDIADALCMQLHEADTILLGRVTYSAMAAYWPHKAYDPSFPREDVAFAEMMNTHAKIVFSKTLAVARWNNTRIVNTGIAREVTKLKKQQGKNMVLYGSGQLAAALIKLGLVDEYRLWVHPVLLGRGTPLFHRPAHDMHFALVDAKAFGSGVVALCYRPC